MSGSFTAAAAGVIFTCTYFVLAIGKLPGFHLDRTGAALLGASLMVAFGVLSPAEAFRAIDGNTIVLLLGMMIVVANLKLSGFPFGHQLDRLACTPSADPAVRDRLRFGLFFCLPRQ
jgi:di/tricarboxylate transporter